MDPKNALTGGPDTAGALGAAKLEILMTRLNFADTNVSLAHPFFWAPFVLIGSAD